MSVRPINEKVLTFPSRYFLFLAVGWGLTAAWLGFVATSPGSPDEAANGFFIEHLARTGNLAAQSDLTAEQLSYWHPRSLRVDGTALKPGSFLGLILAGGGVDKVFGNSAHLVLTPLFGMVALLALYGILRRFWSPRWSGLGVSLVATHPAWWQFQTLPLYHNGAFASLLIIAGWRLMRLWDDGRMSNAVWFGLAYGGALFFRPVEALWTAPLVAIVLLAQKKWRALFLAAGVTMIVQLPWLIIGWQLYGSGLGSGYEASQLGDSSDSAANALAPLTTIVTPPGGWSWNWLHSAWHYFVLLVPTWSLATSVALAFYIRRIRTNRLKLVKISLVSLAALIPLIYYGTWNLYPLETPEAIGSLASYARYWLPLYVPMMVGVLWLLKRISALRWRALVMLGLFLSQIVTIIWHPNAGVLDRLAGNRRLQEQRRLVLARTPNNSAVVAGQMDKILFPDRIASFDLPRNDSEWSAFQSLATTRPVYLYVTPRQYDLHDLNSVLAMYGLMIDERQLIGGDELWEIKSL